VLRGFAPTVGIVSVFDTDYTTAQRYELDVVSAPPFQPFPAETVSEHAALVNDAEVIVVAPVFFGPGNLEPLRAALRAAQAGKRLILVNDPPAEQRDLSGGEATGLLHELTAAGASVVTGSAEVVDMLCGLKPAGTSYPEKS
jgi:hypothetical protein